jgi:hypothetical protein
LKPTGKSGSRPLFSHTKRMDLPSGGAGQRAGRADHDRAAEPGSLDGCRGCPKTRTGGNRRASPGSPDGCLPRALPRPDAVATERSLETRNPALQGFAMRRRGLEPPAGHSGPALNLVTRCQICPMRRNRPERPRIWTHWTRWTIWMLPRMLQRPSRGGRRAGRRCGAQRMWRQVPARGRGDDCSIVRGTGTWEGPVLAVQPEAGSLVQSMGTVRRLRRPEA